MAQYDNIFDEIRSLGRRISALEKITQIQDVVVETHFTLLDQVRFTADTSWVYAAPAQNQPLRVLLNPEDFAGPNVGIYFEVVHNMDGAAKSEARLYNITDAAAVTGSVLTTLGIGSSNSQRMRTGALTLTPGYKEYAVQHHRVGGLVTEYPAVLMARLIVRYST